MTGGITETKTFGYDLEGIVRSITTNGSTVWLSTDYADRVTRFDYNTGPGQGSVVGTNTYNGAGLRTFYHSKDGVDHPLVYDGSSPGAPLLASGATLFTPGLMQQTGSAQTFWQTDALGSVRGTSDTNQNPTGEVYYDAFGLPSLRQGQMPGPLGWAATSGYQTDADSGLVLIGNRYYDPTIGRFLSEDPAGDGDNWYTYCDNDPLDYVDPTGLTMRGAAPTPSDVDDPLGEMSDDEREQADEYYSGLYLNKYTDHITETTHAGVTVVHDPGYQLDWSVPLGQDYSGYFQLTATPLEQALKYIHPRHWQRVMAAESKLLDILSKDMGRHVSAAQKQIVDQAGHNKEMIGKFGRDFDHVQDLSTLINGLHRRLGDLKSAGVESSEAGQKAFGDLMKSGQDVLNYINDAFEGFGI